MIFSESGRMANRGTEASWRSSFPDGNFGLNREQRQQWLQRQDSRMEALYLQGILHHFFGKSIANGGNWT